jgi:hypothetical protein
MPWAKMVRNDPQRLRARAPTRSRNLQRLCLRQDRIQANRPMEPPASRARHRHPIDRRQQATRSPGHRPQRVTRSPVHPLQAVTQSPNHRNVRARQLPSNNRHRVKANRRPRPRASRATLGRRTPNPLRIRRPTTIGAVPTPNRRKRDSQRAQVNRTVHRKQRNSRPNSRANRTGRAVATRRARASRPTRNRT